MVTKALRAAARKAIGDFVFFKAIAGLIVGLNLSATCAQDAPDIKVGLTAALQAALQSHPSVAGKRADVRGKDAATDATRAQRYPSLTMQAQQNNVSYSSLNSPGIGTLRVRQPLWAFGRIDSSIDAAAADAQTMRGDLLRVQRQLIENTAVAYSRVVAARLRLQVANDNLAAHEQWLQQIRRREQGQLASQADVRLAQARASDARAQLERIDTELLLAREELQALTIQPIEVEQELDSSLLESVDFAEAQGRAYDASAELRYRQLKITASSANLEQAAKSAMPTIYAQAEHYVNAGTLYQPTPRYSIVLEGGVDGMGFVTRGRVAAAAAQLESADEDLKVGRFELARAVKSHWHNHRMALRLLREQQTSSGDLMALLASYKRQYEAGTKSWLDVLNMQRELSERQLQMAQAKGDAYAFALRLKAITAALDDIAGLGR